MAKREAEDEIREDKQRAKYEQRLRKRLRLAQKDHDKVVERVQRAQERLQKRTVRLQKVEARFEAVRPSVLIEGAVFDAEREKIRVAHTVVVTVEEAVREISERALKVAHREMHTDRVLLLQDASIELLSPAVDIEYPEMSTLLEDIVVEEIYEEEDEESIEAVAAMIISDAAGIVAAEAEAMAEACSVRTREARTQAQEAGYALEHVRALLQEGTLTGEHGLTVFAAAEREVEKTHAALVAAELAEKQAVQAAMNAAAEAAIAEGLAFANDTRNKFS